MDSFGNFLHDDSLQRWTFVWAKCEGQVYDEFGQDGADQCCKDKPPEGQVKDLEKGSQVVFVSGRRHVQPETQMSHLNRGQIEFNSMYQEYKGALRMYS